MRSIFIGDKYRLGLVIKGIELQNAINPAVDGCDGNPAKVTVEHGPVGLVQEVFLLHN